MSRLLVIVLTLFLFTHQANADWYSDMVKKGKEALDKGEKMLEDTIEDMTHDDDEPANPPPPPPQEDDGPSHASGHDVAVEEETHSIAQGGDQGHKTPDLGQIPIIVLVNKYAPDALGDKYLLEQTRLQIGYDQVAYQRSVPDYVHMFSKAQVPDRQIDFLTEELLPEYRKKLSQISEGIPETLSFEHNVSLKYLEYKDGHIRSNSTRGQGPTVLYRHSDMPKLDKLQLSPLGPSHLVTFLITRIADSSRYPESTWRARVPRPVYLSVDRSLSIPPIAVDRARAEKIFTRPDCNAIRKKRSDAMMNVHKAKAQASTTGNKSAVKQAQQEEQRLTELENKCHADMQVYSQTGIKLVHVLDVYGFETTDRYWIFKAKLRNVEVRDWRGELLKSLPANQFAVAEDVWQEKVQIAAGKEKAKADATKNEQTARQAMGKSLASADVVGIRLDMSFDQAEKAVRKHMKVMGVVQRKSEDHTNAFMSDLLGYHGPGGAERIFLFTQTADSNRLAAVSRLLALPEGLEPDKSDPHRMPASVRKQLIQKYGEPSKYNLGISGVVWTASEKGAKECGITLRDSSDVITEGKTQKDYNNSMKIIPHAAYKLKRDSLERMASECGPTVNAQMWGDSLRVTLFDLASYAKEAIVNLKEPEPMDLKL